MISVSSSIVLSFYPTAEEEVHLDVDWTKLFCFSPKLKIRRAGKPEKHIRGIKLKIENLQTHKKIIVYSFQHLAVLCVSLPTVFFHVLSIIMLLQVYTVYICKPWVNKLYILQQCMYYTCTTQSKTDRGTL